MGTLSEQFWDKLEYKLAQSFPSDMLTVKEITIAIFENLVKSPLRRVKVIITAEGGAKSGMGGTSKIKGQFVTYKIKRSASEIILL